MKREPPFSQYLANYFPALGRLLVLASSVCAPTVGIAETSATHPYCSIVEEARGVVEATRGSTFSSPVACRVLDRKLIGDYVRSRLQEELGPCELEYEGVVLRALGMLPESFDYLAAVHSIYETALGGFYDPRTKSFSMADWISPSSQRGVAIHELVHALQDQRWDLDRFVDAKHLSGDEILARMALVEGEATALVIDAEQRAAGQTSLAKGALLNESGFEEGFSAPFSPDYPDSLQQLVQFPYTAGLRYVAGLLSQGGYQKVDGAFKSPPRSTEEILHPAKGRLSPQDFEKLPEWKSSSAYGHSVYSDTLGEFVTRVILRENAGSLSHAITGAEGWGGDRVELFAPPKHQSEFLVVWQTSWDSASDAKEFVRTLLGEGLKGFGKVSPLTKSRRILVRGGEIDSRFVRLNVFVWFKVPSGAGSNGICFSRHCSQPPTGCEQ